MRVTLILIATVRMMVRTMPRRFSRRQSPPRLPKLSKPPLKALKKILSLIRVTTTAMMVANRHQGNLPILPQRLAKKRQRKSLLLS